MRGDFGVELELPEELVFRGNPNDLRQNLLKNDRISFKLLLVFLSFSFCLTDKQEKGLGPGARRFQLYPLSVRFSFQLSEMISVALVSCRPGQIEESGFCDDVRPNEYTFDGLAALSCPHGSQIPCASYQDGQYVIAAGLFVLPSIDNPGNYLKYHSSF